MVSLIVSNVQPGGRVTQTINYKELLILRPQHTITLDLHSTAQTSRSQ